MINNLPYQNATINLTSKDIHPTEIDILCGRGKTYAHHPGNIVFNKAVEDNLQNYLLKTKRTDKSIVVAELVNLLQSSGARFMKCNKAQGTWRVLTHSEAHYKVGHAIRDLAVCYKRQGKTAPLGPKKYTNRKRALKKVPQQTNLNKYEGKVDFSSMIAPLPIHSNVSTDTLLDALYFFSGTMFTDATTSGTDEHMVRGDTKVLDNTHTHNGQNCSSNEIINDFPCGDNEAAFFEQLREINWAEGEKQNSTLDVLPLDHSEDAATKIAREDLHQALKILSCEIDL